MWYHLTEMETAVRCGINTVTVGESGIGWPAVGSGEEVLGTGRGGGSGRREPGRPQSIAGSFGDQSWTGIDRPGGRPDRSCRQIVDRHRQRSPVGQDPVRGTDDRPVRDRRPVRKSIQARTLAPGSVRPQPGPLRCFVLTAPTLVGGRSQRLRAAGRPGLLMLAVLSGRSPRSNLTRRDGDGAIVLDRATISRWSSVRRLTECRCPLECRGPGTFGGRVATSRRRKNHDATHIAW